MGDGGGELVGLGQPILTWTWVTKRLHVVSVLHAAWLPIVTPMISDNFMSSQFHMGRGGGRGQGEGREGRGMELDQPILTWTRVTKGLHVVSVPHAAWLP